MVGDHPIDPQQEKKLLGLYASSQFPEAFAILAELYRPFIYRTIQRRLRGYLGWKRLDVEVDDVVSEVLSSVHQSLMRHPAISSMDQPRIWVRQQSIWTFQTILRKYARRDHREPLITSEDDENGGGGLGALERTLQAPGPTPEEAASLDQQKSLLGRCLERLTERSREVVRLWTLGVALQRIADRLGYANLQGVDRVRRKAVVALRRCMDPESVESPEPMDVVGGGA